MWTQIASAGANIIGSQMDRDESRRQAVKNRNAQKTANKRNIEYQKEFAQHGIRWRVDDAKAAGIHPLAALGANTPSFTPSVQAFQDNTQQTFGREMGQNIGRAIQATQTAEERKKKEIADYLLIEKAQLENDLLRSQITSINSQNSNPAFPSNSGLPGHLISGQGNSPVMEKPMERTASATGKPHQEAGHVADFGFAKTSTGLAIVPSNDIKNKIEDQMIPELSWAIRNLLIPNLGWTDAARKMRPSTKDYPLPKNYYWKWNPLQQEYQPQKMRGAIKNDYKPYSSQRYYRR